jgi:hypothetical protein
LFIAPRYSGGIDGHAAMLAKKLQGTGYYVDLMQVPHIPITNLKNPSFAIFSTLKGFSSKNYDIVHTFNVIPEWYRDRIQKKFSITVEEWEEREGVSLEDGLYRGLMRRGSGDELAAGCAESDVP